MSVNTSGVSNQMLQVWPDRFSYEWVRAAMEGYYILMDWVRAGAHKYVRGWGSKPSCLISSPLYRFQKCRLKFVYCPKTSLRELGGGGGGEAELKIHKSRS